MPIFVFFVENKKSINNLSSAEFPHIVLNVSALAYYFTYW